MEKKSSTLATTVLILSILAALAAALFVLGAQMGLWEPIVGFRLSRSYNDLIGYGVCGLALICLLVLFIKGDRAGMVKSGVAGVIGLIILGPTIASSFQSPVKYPPIHDITTDTSAPPEFLTLTDGRDGAANTLVYGGPEVAVQQKEAFPDIEPISSEMSSDDAYAEALRVGQEMGWEIISSDPASTRFEAMARTRFFGFVDDIVVAVSPEGSGSRVDLRSVSRVGRGDRGMNAMRVRDFIKSFNS